MSTWILIVALLVGSLLLLAWALRSNPTEYERSVDELRRSTKKLERAMSEALRPAITRALERMAEIANRNAK